MLLTILPAGGTHQEQDRGSQGPLGPSTRGETGPPPPTNGQPAPAGTPRPGPSAEPIRTQKLCHRRGFAPHQEKHRRVG